MRQFSSKITKTCFDTSTLCNLIDFLARMIDKIQYFSFSAKKLANIGKVNAKFCLKIHLSLFLSGRPASFADR